MNKIVKAQVRHVETLVRNMRDQDAAELGAGVFDTPRNAALMSLTLSSAAFTWLVDGEVAAVFGVAPIYGRPGVGCPWMLGTNLVKDNQVYFLRHCRRVVDEFLSTYPLLENQVHADNTLALRWLKWCGFQFDDPEPTGRNGELFIQFYKEAPCVT